MVADGLYMTVAVKKFLEDNCITFVSKPQTNKKNAEGPLDPRDLKVQIYKGRAIVENVYADDQNFRGFATRYDKLMSSFRGGIELTTWHYGGRPHKVRKSKYLEGCRKFCLGSCRNLGVVRVGVRPCSGSHLTGVLVGWFPVRAARLVFVFTRGQPSLIFYATQCR